jgi:hypothetical protein
MNFKNISQIYRMKWQFLLLQAGFARAAIRFGCSSVSIQRLDPLVEPGQIPSAHVGSNLLRFRYRLTVLQGAPDRRYASGTYYIVVHTLIGGTGGDAFNATMEGDIGEQGSCTTCAYSEGMTSATMVATLSTNPDADFSNYWTAALYFRHQNGSYKRVPIYPNAQLGT